MKNCKVYKVVSVLVTEYGSIDLPSNIEFKLGDNVRVDDKDYTINNIENNIETFENDDAFLTKIYHTSKRRLF